MRNVFRLLIGTSVLAAVSGGAMSASAQVATTSESPVAEGETPGEGDIIVTATRRSENLQKVPISMTVVDAAAVSRMSSPSELAKMIPNVQLEQTSGVSFQRIGIRGIASSDFNPNATTSNMVYLDEIPLNAPVAQGVVMWDLGRVEVLRGPQGTLFGRNATGGAIRYIARTPGDTWSGEGSASFGRFNAREFRGAVGGPVGENAGIRLSFISRNTDGYAYDIARNVREGKDHYYGVRGIFAWDPTDNIRAVLSAQYFKGGSDPVMVKSTPGLATKNGAVSASAIAALKTQYGSVGISVPSKFYKVEQDMPSLEDVEHIPVSLNLDFDLGGAVLTATTGYLSVNQTFWLDEDGSTVPLLNAIYNTKDRQWTQEVRLTSAPGSPLQWIVGGFYMHEKIQSDIFFHSTETIIPAGFNVPSAFYTRASLTKTESLAAFGNLTYELSDRLKVSAGLRYTHESKDITYNFRRRYTFPTSASRTRFEALDFIRAVETGNYGTLISSAGPPMGGGASWNNLSWKVGVDYQINAGMLLYGLVSRGFKGGSFQPNANLPSQVFVGGNLVSVKPETITDYEVGLKTDIIPGKLRINASAYYYDYQNYQTNQFISAIGGQLLSSLPKARVIGAEMEFRAEPVAGLVFQGGVGVTDAKITEALDPRLNGRKLPLAENFNANGAASYRLKTNAGSFIPEISFKHRGEYFTNKDNDKKLGGYTTYDAQVGYESPGGVIFGSLWVKNLSDVRVPIVVDDVTEFFGGDFAYISAPKTYGLTIGARF